MKVSCDVIQDLLPLYVEDMVSEESRKLVEEHLPTCEDCRQMLDEMRQETPMPVDTNPAPIKKVQNTFRKRKIQAVIVAALMSAIFVVMAVGYLTAPNFQPYTEETVTVTEEANGNVIATFGEGVTDYEVTLSGIDDEQLYFITAWNTAWGRFRDHQPAPVVINPAGEAVDGVFFDESMGRQSIQIFGEERNGGIFVMPRQFLAYYLLFALIGFVVFAGIALLAGNHPRLRDWATRIALIPAAYMMGHLLIKGVKTSSYAAQRDFFAIMLVTILLYLLFLFVYRYVLRKKEIVK